ncbi:hypothetical protein PGTUg99_036999 [Puccinia graminis f. sp. tritici]|uniref:Mediator of RNA polymerase II transcription subunit 1 n=1 Tax=Puccinia graminis f. sp. tritici TaxID=56615 RepID=A0A5B0RNE0_PUCGR|nr:hypothetical protein PGTUg99_036999 [Puccinia graminis f. sp. tritici]
METTNQGENEALKNSLINLSYQSIDRFDQTFQNILSQTHPTLHLHPLSTPVDSLADQKLALIQSLDLINQSLRQFDKSISKASAAAVAAGTAAATGTSSAVVDTSSSSAAAAETSTAAAAGTATAETSTAAAAGTATATAATTVTNTTNQSIIKLFALLRQSSLHLNSLIQSQSFIKQLNNQSNHHPTDLSSSLSSLDQQKNLLPRATYLDPSLIIENLPADQRSQTSLPLIEALAREIGLECFRDSDDSNLLTIAGKLFVIDIEIDPNHDQTHGQVNRSKFSYTFAEEEAKRDLSIDQELTHQLSDIHHLFQSQPPHSFCNLAQLELVQNSLQSFAGSLRQLKELDELMVNSNQSSSIDYFMVFRKLISDYHQHQSEQDQLGKTDEPIPPIRVPPSGIPLTSVNQLKLDLVYHYNATDLLKDAIKTKSSHGLAISVALTPTTTHASTHPDSLQPPPAPLTTTTATTTSSTGQAGTKGLFTAHFYPPLAVSRVTAAALAQVSAIDLPPPSSSSTLTTTHSYHHDQGGSIDHVTPLEDIFLEDLLVYQSMSSINHHQNKTDWDIKASNWKTKQFGKAFDRGLSQVYCFLDPEDDGYSGDPNSRLGFLITQVRFDNLDSLLKIIKICQRQAIFNELFNSCFNSDCYLPKQQTRRLPNLLGQTGLNGNALSSDQQRNNTYQEGEGEEELDPFKGFQSSDYLATLQNQPCDRSGFSNSSRLFKYQDGQEEISIDVILNHATHSITLQFIPSRPHHLTQGQSLSSSTSSPTKPKPDVSNPDAMVEDGGEENEEDDDEFRLISLTFSVTEPGSIRLLSHSLFVQLTPNTDIIMSSDTPDLLPHGGGPIQESSSLKIAVLEDSLDRVRCLPVLLNTFFLHHDLPSFPVFVP